jgi:hypothetical protein
MREKTGGGRRLPAALAGYGDDVASRGVAVGGETRTSPETVTTRLAVASPAGVRKKSLGEAGAGLRVPTMQEELRGEVSRPKPRRRWG